MSLEGLTRISVFLPYAAICLLAYWRLIPRLLPSAKWLATVMLAVQLLIIFISLTLKANTTFQALLWELRHEWNIPATFATTQLALISAISLVTSWLARRDDRKQAIFLAVIGALFLYFAWDEYYTIHESIPHWDSYYAILGLILAGLALLLAWRSSTSARVWFYSLLSGLAVSALGAIALERLTHLCEELAYIHADVCANIFVWEEGLEFLGVWIALVAVLGFFSDLALPPSPRARRFLLSFPAFWLLLLVINSLLPRFEIMLLARPAAVQFKSGVRLDGYRLDFDSKRGTVQAQLYTTAEQQDYFYLGYSIHLIDQGNFDSVASRNEWAYRHHGLWVLGPEYEPVYRTQISVDLPEDFPSNRALWAVLSLWRPQDRDYSIQKVLSSDHLLLGDSQVILGEFTLRDEAAAAGASARALFANGFALEAVELPAEVQAGENLGVSFAWRTDSPDNADYIQFLHLGHEASDEWFVFDQQPLGARLPTRLWYAGLADREKWQVPLPAELAPGRYLVFTGLYRASDNERLAAQSAGGGGATSWTDVYRWVRY